MIQTPPRNFEIKFSMGAHRPNFAAMNVSIGAMLHPALAVLADQFSQVRELGLQHVQIGYNAALDTAAGVAQLREIAAQNSIEITTVFCGFEGESYADIPTVQRTVGLVPIQTRALRLAKIEEIATFARNLGVSRVGAHIGFIPEDEGEDFWALAKIVGQICDDLARENQVFSLETGQETARGLRHFLETVAKPNLKVNFDPANMILYGNNEPKAALNVLFPWIDGVHCKDGKWPTQNGALGEETPLGAGDVDFAVWLKKLIALGYDGPLTIEREISGPHQARDIARGRDLIREILGL